MGKRIEAIRRLEQSSPQEVMAGYLFNFVVNGEEHFFKTKYYEYTAYFELNHDNDVYMIDVLYLGQETSFPLSTFMRKVPDYKSVLAITPQLLEWLENTYAVNGTPVKSVKPKKPKRPRKAPRPVMMGPLAGSVLNQNALNTSGREKSSREESSREEKSTNL